MEHSEKELMKKGIVIGIGLFLLDLILFVFFVGSVFNKGGNSNFNPLFFLLLIPLAHFLAGLYCGRRWPNPSWKWGIWFAIPLIILKIILTIFIIITKNFGHVSVAAYLNPLDIIFILISSIGAYFGARPVNLPTVELRGYSDKIKQTINSVYPAIPNDLTPPEKELNSYRKQIKQLGIKIGIIILFFFIVCAYIIKIYIIKSNDGFSILCSILILLLACFIGGIYCGKCLLGKSWRLGFWLTIPLAIVFISYLIYVEITAWDPENMIGILYFIIIFLYSVAFLTCSAGAYCGAYLSKK
jgi:hypothetical protein